MPALTDPKAERFCQEYAKTGHGPRSTLAAGYGEQRSRVAHTLLQRADIVARIREITGQAMNAADITPERVMKELGRIAFQDVRSLYDHEGNMRAIPDLDDDTAATIAGIDVEVRYEGRGDEAVPVVVKKIRRVDKMAALNVLAKHFKIVGDEGDGVNALASALADRLNNAKRRMNTATEGAEDARIIPRGALEAPDGEPVSFDYPAAPQADPRPIIEPAAPDDAAEAVAIPLPAASPAGAAPPLKPPGNPSLETPDEDDLW